MATQEKVEFDALDETIESHIKNLLQILGRPHSLEEMQAEVSSLNDLLYTFSRRNELIQKLIDGATPEERRRRIAETLATLRMKVSVNRDEIVRLREKSNDLIKRATGIVSRAQREIDKQAYLHAGYDIKSCGMCKGLCHTDGGTCAACNGEGTVLVRQPAKECRQCKGSGVEQSLARQINRACAICSGTGWIFAAKKNQHMSKGN